MGADELAPHSLLASRVCFLIKWGPKPRPACLTGLDVAINVGMPGTCLRVSQCAPIQTLKCVLLSLSFRLCLSPTQLWAPYLVIG